MTLRAALVLLLVASPVAADKAKAPGVADIQKVVRGLESKLSVSKTKKKPDLVGALDFVSAPFVYDGLEFYSNDACTKKFGARGVAKTGDDLMALLGCLPDSNWGEAIGDDEWKAASLARLPKALRKGGARLKTAAVAGYATSYVTHAENDDNWNLYRVIPLATGHRLDGLVVGQ